jgi:hypothetical protein
MKKLLVGILAMVLGLLFCGTAIYISRTYNRYETVRNNNSSLMIDKITGNTWILQDGTEYWRFMAGREKTLTAEDLLGPKPKTEDPWDKIPNAKTESVDPRK